MASPVRATWVVRRRASRGILSAKSPRKWTNSTGIGRTALKLEHVSHGRGTNFVQIWRVRPELVEVAWELVGESVEIAPKLTKFAAIDRHGPKHWPNSLKPLRRSVRASAPFHNVEGRSGAHHNSSPSFAIDEKVAMLCGTCHSLTTSPPFTKRRNVVA